MRHGIQYRESARSQSSEGASPWARPSIPLATADLAPPRPLPTDTSGRLPARRFTGFCTARCGLATFAGALEMFGQGIFDFEIALTAVLNGLTISAGSSDMDIPMRCSLPSESSQSTSSSLRHQIVLILKSATTPASWRSSAAGRPAGDARSGLSGPVSPGSTPALGDYPPLELGPLMLIMDRQEPHDEAEP